MTIKMILVRASQRYIDMVDDDIFMLFSAITDSLIENKNLTVYQSRRAASNRCLLTISEQQLELENSMYIDYQNLIVSREVKPQGMLYLTNRQHEYLVFTSNRFSILGSGYVRDFSNISGVEYYD